MNLVKSPKTGVYSAVIQTDHGERSIKTGATDRREAAMIVKRAKVEQLEAAAKVHKLTSQAVQQIVAGKKVTIADAMKEWIVWMENYGRAARSVDSSGVTLAAWVRDAKLENRLPGDITERMVDTWINAADGTCKGTRSARLAVVRSFFQFCCAKAYALGNPSQLVRVKMNLLTHEQKEPRIVSAFTSDELDKLRVAATGFWRVAIAIGRWTGLRMGDICQLEWDSLAVKDRMIVWTDKRDRRVSLPLTLAEFEKDMKARKSPVTKAMVEHFTQCEVELNSTLRSLIKTHPIYAFPEQREVAINPKRRSWLSVQFGRVVQAAGIEGKSFHNIRHAYCQQMDAIGVEIEHIARNVGHSNIGTTRGYMR